MKDFPPKRVRRLVTALVIGSFSVAALLGIIALLGGGELGETEGRVLLTTVIVGVESIAVLCYLALAGRPSWPVGLAGGVVSLVPFSLALWLTWGGAEPDRAWDVFGVSVTLAATFAHAALLLALHRGRRTLLLAGTLMAMAIVAGMICNAILNGEDLGDLYWRTFGVVAILDVLGTVVFAALGIFGRRSGSSGEPGPLLTPALESRVVEAAEAHGVSPSRLVSDALDSFLTKS